MSEDYDYLLCALSRVVEGIQIILDDERTESAEFPDMEKVGEAVPMIIGVAVPADEMRLNEKNMLKYHSEELNKIWKKYEKGKMKIEGAAFLYLLIKSKDWFEEHGEEFFDNIEIN